MLAAFLKNRLRLRPAVFTPAGVGTQRLNVGSGAAIREGWINVTAEARPGVDIVANLDECSRQPLPLADNSIDEIYCSDVLEHLRDALGFMQELHRIAKPNAMATIRVPYGSSDDADENPAYVRRFYEGSFKFFSQPAYTRADYGYRGDWKNEKIELLIPAAHLKSDDNARLFDHVRTFRNVVQEMIVTLRAVKPARDRRSGEADEFPVIVTPVSDNASTRPAKL
jgi:SAM-dependent methyltransferase